MVVVGLLGMLMGGVVVGVRSIGKSELRGAAGRLSGAIRYCFDRAITTGAYYRLVLDLDDNKYWVERSDDRAYLTRGKERSLGGGKARDVGSEERDQDEKDKREEADRARVSGSAAVALEPPPRPRRARFQTFADASLPQVKLGRTELRDVYTPRQPEAYTTGRAYLHFFPDGHTERAFIRLADGDDWYSLIVHPLTGRVQVQAGKLDVPRDFDTDATGAQVAPR